MNDQTAAIRHIDWRQLFPWLMLLRTPRLALTPTAMLAATLGLLLTSLGWHLAGWIGPARSSDSPTKYQEMTAAVPVKIPNMRVSAELTDNEWHTFPSSAVHRVEQPFWSLTAPIRRLFALKAFTFREFWFYVCGTLWTIAVWAAMGGVIVRTAAVRFAWDQPADPWQTTQFVAERLLSYFTAPLYPLLGVAVLMIPLAVAGLLARNDFGALFVALSWCFGLVCAIGAVWLLIPLVVGFPLMWGAVSAERDGDAFEALSISMAYTYQRPLKYCFYVLVLIVVGAFSVFVVDQAAKAIVHVGYWGLSWGSGAERAADVRQLAERGLLGWEKETMPSRVLESAGWLIGMWVGLVYAIATAFRFSFFWTAAAGVYLLLRKDIDDKEIDEVYVPQEEPQLAPVTRRVVTGSVTASPPAVLPEVGPAAPAPSPPLAEGEAMPEKH